MFPGRYRGGMFQLMQPFQHLLLVEFQSLHAGLQLAPVFAYFFLQQIAPQRDHKNGSKDEKNCELVCAGDSYGGDHIQDEDDDEFCHGIFSESASTPKH